MYDIVPPESNLDVLYDMLSSFDEDSVRIYSGLVDPEQGSSQTDALQAAEASAPEMPAASEPQPAEPQDKEESAQPSLLGDEEQTRKIRPASRKKRASVPSWDEIMFGAPKKDDK